jgi:glucosamine kinase
MRFLALDAGQSGVRSRILRDSVTKYDGETGTLAADRPMPVLTAERYLASHGGIRTDLPLAPQLTDVVLEIAAEIAPIDAVAVGSTGFTGSEDLSVLDVLGSSGVRTVLIAHDSITSYLGALGTQEGAVVSSGTGVVTLAVGASALARVDGWGNIMGDAGSGYWFGRAALDAAMRAYDGRGPGTVLLDRLCDEFGYAEGAYIQLQSDPARVRRTASFSRWVTAALADGDRVAAEICKRGAAELALSVTSGLDRVGIDHTAETPICTIGGMFRSEPIAEAFAAELRVHRPAYRHDRPRGDSLDGAAELFALDLSSAIGAHVTRVALA